MKTIVTGSSSITDYETVHKAIVTSGFAISELVSGAGRGVEQHGETWAVNHTVPITRMQSDWLRYGSAAPAVRNRQAIEYADALIAIWDGQCEETKEIIKLAQTLGRKVHIARPFRPASTSASRMMWSHD